MFGPACRYIERGTTMWARTLADVHGTQVGPRLEEVEQLANIVIDINMPNLQLLQVWKQVTLLYSFACSCGDVERWSCSVVASVYKPAVHMPEASISAIYVCVFSAG